jgi:hypothetical protein
MPGNVAAILAANAPGMAGEARPHGVPVSWNWANAAVFSGLNPPAPDREWVNLWGQIYVDESDIHVPNSRVAVADCEMWQLHGGANTWQQVQGNAPVEGAAWSEDFSRSGGPFSIRNEPDGSQSMAPAAGWNAHFWTRASLARLGGGNRAIIVACSARLVLADPYGLDDRGSARYLISLGADWRRSNYDCGGACVSVGISRFVRVTPTWQRVVMSTIAAGDIAFTPAVPAEVFANPG